jgi:hypothetical protein
MTIQWLDRLITRRLAANTDFRSEEADLAA